MIAGSLEIDVGGPAAEHDVVRDCDVRACCDRLPKRRMQDTDDTEVNDAQHRLKRIMTDPKADFFSKFDANASRYVLLPS